MLDIRVRMKSYWSTLNNIIPEFKAKFLFEYERQPAFLHCKYYCAHVRMAMHMIVSIKDFMLR